MGQRDFEIHIKQELKAMNREQAVFFAWLCAVRAIPFLGTKGNFNFWDEKDRMKHLYAIFFSLDLIRYNQFSLDFIIRPDAASASLAAADAARAAATARTAYYFARAAAANTRTAYDVRSDVYTEASYVTSNVTASATNAAYYSDTVSRCVDFQNIQIEDLSAIKKGQKTFDSHLELYGEVWDNFHTKARNRSYNMQLNATDKSPMRLKKITSFGWRTVKFIITSSINVRIMMIQPTGIYSCSLQ